MRISFPVSLAAAALLLLSPGARAEEEGASKPVKPVKLVTRAVPPEAQESPLDVNKATRAYLNLVTGAEREKSDAYFEGDYWLQLWSFLYGLGVAAVLLYGRLSSRMRALAERLVPWRWLQPAVYAVQWTAVGTVLTFPLDVYRGYFREHQYGLSNLTFGGWMEEQGKGFALGILFGALGL